VHCDKTLLQCGKLKRVVETDRFSPGLIQRCHGLGICDLGHFGHHGIDPGVAYNVW
jgi:hypothetical protein